MGGWGAEIDLHHRLTRRWREREFTLEERQESVISHKHIMLRSFDFRSPSLFFSETSCFTFTLAEKVKVVFEAPFRRLSRRLHYACECVCVWLEDLTAAKLMIELLILSDLTARLAIFISFYAALYLYIFFSSLSCKRAQYVNLQKGHTHTVQTNTGVNSTCTHTHTHRRCDGSLLCQVIRQCRQSCGLPCGLESFQTAGQEARTTAPHAPRLVSHASHPPPLPPAPSQASPLASPSASHRAGQEPSEEPGRMRDDGQAVSGVNSRPLSGQRHGQTAHCDMKQQNRKQSRSGNPQNAGVLVGFVV